MFISQKKFGMYLESGIFSFGYELDLDTPSVSKYMFNFYNVYYSLDLL